MDPRWSIAVLLSLLVWSVSAQRSFVVERVDDEQNNVLRCGNEDGAGIPYEVAKERQTLLTEITGNTARSTLLTHMRNDHSSSATAELSFNVPDHAYITLFEVTIDGEVYRSTVMEKAQAQQTYDRAVSNGQSAGLVQERKSVRGMTMFSVSVHLEPHARALFKLQYDEILVKRLGRYQLRFDSQSLDSARVYGYNAMGWASAEAPSVSQSDLEVDVRNKELFVTYEPSAPRSVSADGRFVLELTPREAIDRPLGSVMTYGEYFAHVISAPDSLQTLPKATVFVLDCSGSMSGRRIAQAKAAVQYAVGLLNDGDRFNIVRFSHSTDALFEQMTPVTPQSLERASRFVSDMSAGGGTNIEQAMLTALRMLDTAEERFPKTVVLLTDGDPTMGESDPQRLLASITASNTAKATVYALGFGMDMKFDLLDDMATDHRGFSRRIYEDVDTDQQFEEIFAEVNSPKLVDIDIQYDPEDDVSELTRTRFPILFAGSELLVAGKSSKIGKQGGLHVTLQARLGLDDRGLGELPLDEADRGGVRFEGFVEAERGQRDELELESELHHTERDSDGAYGASGGDETNAFALVESTWAYLTVSQRVKAARFEARGSSTPLSQTVSGSHGLQIALARGMVTPFTSLVVVLPEREGEPLERARADAETGAHRERAGSPRSFMKHAAGGAPPQPFANFGSFRTNQAAFQNVAASGISTLGVVAESASMVSQMDHDGGDSGAQILLLDVVRLSIGVEGTSGEMITLLHRNSLVPTKKTQTLSVLPEAGGRVVIRVFEGERLWANDNLFGGEIQLTGVPEGAQVTVTVEVDVDGIITITAVDTVSGVRGELVLDRDRDHRSWEEIDNCVEAAERLREHDLQVPRPGVVCVHCVRL